VSDCPGPVLWYQVDRIEGLDMILYCEHCGQIGCSANCLSEHWGVQIVRVD